LFLKCENRQHSGSFKFRGACHALLSLSAEERRRGVLTASSGNHGAALALAGQLLDSSVWVVVPENAPKAKIRNIERFGARIFFCGPRIEDRETRLADLMAESGRRVIPPYNHPKVILGQATSGLEIIEEGGGFDAVIAPVGGGGLMSGTIIAFKTHAPATRLIGAEPAGADDAYRSLQAGRIVPSLEPDTVCDGLLTSLGDLTFPILQRGLEKIVRVADADTLEAMHWIAEALQMNVEPSSAITLAAAFNLRAELGGSRVALILSGGNIDPPQ
jgi:threonine dehydratase